MKKNKFTRNSVSASQNPSPIMLRKYEASGSTSGVLCSDGKNCPDNSGSSNTVIAKTHTSNENYQSRLRSNSYGAAKDHGYETIPADAARYGNNNIPLDEQQSIRGTMATSNEYRKSDGYAHVLQKEWKPDSGK